MQGYLACRLEPGIEPPTVRLVNDLQYLLSYNRPYKKKHAYDLNECDVKPVINVVGGSMDTNSEAMSRGNRWRRVASM